MPAPSTVGAGKGRGPRALGLRAHIVALAASALLPAFAVGAIAVGAAVDSYRRAFEARLQGTAGALASAVDAEIDTYVVGLSVLATARGLDADGDLPGFQERARRSAEILGTRIYALAPDMSLVLHSSFPTGADPAASRHWESLDLVREVFATGRPAVGDLLTARMSGRPVAPVYVPVSRDGKVVYVLGAVVEAARISRVLGAQTFPDGGYASLVDGQGKLMARSADHERFVGQRVRDWMREGAGKAASGVLQGPNLSGTKVTTAFHHVPGAPGWFVTVAEPDAAYYSSLRQPLATLALGGVGTLALALLAAWATGRRILGPVDWLTRKAERVAASGGAVEVVPEGPPVRVREFERLRAAVLQAHVTLQERASAVAAGEARLRAVVDTAVDAIVVIDDRGTIQSFNRAAEAIFGHAAAEAVGRNVSMLVGGEHGAKHDRYLAAYRETGVRKAVGHLRDLPGRRKDGSAVPLDISIAEWRDGGGGRFFTAIMRDVSERKADEARRTLLMREVDHRAKNALAVVQSVLRLTPRDEPGAFAAVEARVAALARVHSLLAEGGWSGTDLRAVAERELAPYAPARVTGAAVPRATVSLDGPPVPLAAAAVQPLAMVLHELATNAAKHGALSLPGGAVAVRWRAGGGAEDGGMLRLRWTETGGPPVAGAPMRRGFGTRVVEATVRGQLGGTVERRWERTGLVVEVAVPLARLAADAQSPAPGRREPGQPSAGQALDTAADAPASPLDRPLTLAGGEREGGSEREQRPPGEVVRLWPSRRAGGRAGAGPAPPGDDQRTR